MTNRFVTPQEQFCDGTGTPYAGGSLTFYASGTTTLQATYSDKALSIANTNPVVLDSAGRPLTDIFLQNLAYKVVLEDSTGAQIWTKDPVYASDYSTVAQVQGVNGNPNGQLAGTAGSATIPASMAWDYTNSILYVCTTTGTSTTAVWAAVNSTSSQSYFPAPQGRLTLTSGTPVLSSDVVASTTVSYTAAIGNSVPIFNGTTFSVQNFSADLTLTLSASHAANTLYDVFAFLNSGVLTLATGPAWAVSTPGSCARGTGAGTTQITRISGLWINSAQLTGRNGATTYTIAANQATYLGTIYIDATAGQVTCHVAAGQNRKYGVWNAYNREPVSLQANDPTGGTQTISVTQAVGNAPSAYSATVFNVGSGTAANGVTVLCGLAEEMVDVDYGQNASNVTGTSADNTVGIGLNSVSAQTGSSGRMINAVNGQYSWARALLEQPAFLGLNVFAMTVTTSTVSMNFVSNAGNRLAARYRA